MSLEPFVKNRNAFPTGELDRYIGDRPKTWGLTASPP